MSYVLDALKRADAERERERGAVPGLHAQPMPALEADTPPPGSGRPWLWLALGLAAGLLAAFALLVGQREPVREAAALPDPAPPRAADPGAALAPPPLTRLPAVAAVPPRETKPAAATPETEPRVHALAELPEAVRRELPALAVGGSVYSSDPKARFLVINGRVVHEKEEVAPGLRLEQIKLKSAVLSYREWHYAISF